MGDSGRHAYRGFEYQIQASAWLLVAFLTEQDAGAEAVVEPLSGEDLEILRRDDETETGNRTTALGVSSSAHRYIIQVKGRRAGAWTAGELGTILEGRGVDRKGSLGRVWPLEVLRTDPTAAFLFVTDTAVAPSLAPLLVEVPWFAPRPGALVMEPVCLKKAGEGLQRRVGVVQKHLIEHVRHRLDLLLAERLHVPHGRRTACAEALAERVRQALLDARRGSIRMAELQKLARDHGGLPTGPEPFVEPARFSALRRLLEAKHVLVLTGEPGVGKTVAAERLVYEHRTRPAPFAIEEPRTPRELSAFRGASGPVLFYLEDPFGKDRQEARSREWLDELDRFCRRASSDVRLLVTSRSSFFPDVGSVAPRLDKHKVELHEGWIDGAALLTKHLDAEPGMDAATRAWIEDDALMISLELKRAVSYDALTGSALHVPPEDRSAQRLRALVKEAAAARIGTDLVETFQNGSEAELSGLAAVWLALEAWPHASDDLRRQFAQLRDDLLDVGAEVSSVVEKLRKHRWLRETERGWKMHSLLLDACRRVLQGRDTLTVKVVTHALLAHHARDNTPAVSAMLRAVDGRFRIPDATMRRLAERARDFVVQLAPIDSAQDSFAPALSLLAETSATGDPLAVLARALQPRDPREPDWFVGVSKWKTPEWDAATRKAVRAHPETVPVVRAFVRHRFPGLPHWFFGERELVDFLYSLADVSEEFDALVEDLEGFDRDADLVALGAVRSGNASLDALLEKALDIERQTDAWGRDIECSDEDSEAESEAISEQWYERIRPARALVDAVLDRRARCGDRLWVSKRSEPLIFERFAEHVEHGGEKDPSVIAAVIAACPPESRGSIVRAAARQDELFDLAVRAIPEAPPEEWREIFYSAVDHRRYDDASFQQAKRDARDVVLGAMDKLPPHQRVAMAYELWAHEPDETEAAALLTNLDEDERAAVAVLQGDAGATAQRVLPLLERVASSEMNAARVALVALAREGRLLMPQIAAWLCPSDSQNRATAALDAVATSAGALDFLRVGLAHRRAAVRQHAVERMASDLGEEATESIVSAASDGTGSVRVAVARALAGRPSPRAWTTLVRLLEDSRDMSSAALHGMPNEHDPPEYRVAIAAALALDAMIEWPEDLRAAILDFASKKVPTRSAPEVRALIRRATSQATRA